MLLCGADILDSMVTPGVWTESDLHTILSRGIVCIKREGSDPEKVINEHDVLYKYRHNIHLVRSWVENNVSRYTLLASRSLICFTRVTCLAADTRIVILS